MAKAKAKTSMDKARALYSRLFAASVKKDGKKNAHVDRQSFLKTMVNKNGMTPAGASSYYTTVKNENA